MRSLLLRIAPKVVPEIRLRSLFVRIRGRIDLIQTIKAAHRDSGHCDAQRLSPARLQHMHPDGTRWTVRRVWRRIDLALLGAQRFSPVSNGVLQLGV